MLETKLLALTAEYVNYEANEAILLSVGAKPSRSKEDIAAEYGDVLRQYLTGASS